MPIQFACSAFEFDCCAFESRGVDSVIDIGGIMVYSSASEYLTRQRLLEFFPNIFIPHLSGDRALLGDYLSSDLSSEPKASWLMKLESAKNDVFWRRTKGLG